MPVAFLPEAQALQYGRYSGEPTADQLARFFYLDDADRALIMRRREDHIRLGFALQLGTVRFLGTFLADPTAVPAGGVTYISRQLQIEDASCLPRYLHRRVTHHEHVQTIQQHYGYRDFHAPREVFRLVRWLYTRAWLSAECPSVLFDLATARLVEHKVLLPGVSVLERLVAGVRDRAATRLWQRLAQLSTADQHAKLEALLQVPPGARSSPLDRLRRAPTRVSGPALVAACHRLDEIRALGVSDLAFDHLPPNRLRDLARYGAAARAQAIARMAPDRRLATLLAFAHACEVLAMDDTLDLLDLIMTDILNTAQREGKKHACGPCVIWTPRPCSCGRPSSSCATNRLRMPPSAATPLPRFRASSSSTPARKWPRSPAPRRIAITRSSWSAISGSAVSYPPSSRRWRLRGRRQANPSSPLGGSWVTSNPNAIRTCTTRPWP